MVVEIIERTETVDERRLQSEPSIKFQTCRSCVRDLVFFSFLRAFSYLLPGIYSEWFLKFNVLKQPSGPNETHTDSVTRSSL